VRFALGLTSAAVILAASASATAAVPDGLVESGSLRVRIAAQPFALNLIDARGQILRRGRLGVRTEAGRFRAMRATRLRDRGRGLTARLATDAPGGGSLALRIEPVASGVLRIRARAGAGVRSVEASFAAARGAVLTGFGERSNAVDFAGLEVLNYVADGPYREADRALPRAIVPPWGVRDRDDDTYYPVPWLLSSGGYGVLVENDETSRYDLGDSRRRWSVAAEARSLSLLVFAGPRPADALRRFSALTGRQPRSEASWVYGPWFQTGQPNVIPLDEEADIIRTLRRADAPVSAMETQMHFLPCGAHHGLQRYERRRTRQAHAAGLAQLAYFNPHLCESYQPLFRRASAAGLLQRQAGGAPAFTYPTFVGGGGGTVGFTREPIAQFDFTAPVPRRCTSGSCARRSTRARTAGWRTSASSRRLASSPPTVRGPSGCTTVIRTTTTAPCVASSAASSGRSRGISARAGPEGRAAPRSCGAGIPPRCGASTALPPP
jgi:hypothetical protein